jgi:hypothetical protein
MENKDGDDELFDRLQVINKQKQKPKSFFFFHLNRHQV